MFASGRHVANSSARALHLRALCACGLFFISGPAAGAETVPPQTRAVEVTSSPAPRDSLVIDWDNGGLDGWQIRNGDEPFLKARIIGVDEGRLSGKRSLLLRAVGYDTTQASNERVLMEYRLPAPMRVDTSTTVSWKWLVRDTDINDGVYVGLTLATGSNRRRSELGWASHSLYARGPRFEDHDPEGQMVRRYESIGESWMFKQDFIDCYEEPCSLVAITFEMWFPIDQEVIIDDFRIGPPLPGERPRHRPPPRMDNLVAWQVADVEGTGQLMEIISSDITPLAFSRINSAGTLERVFPSRHFDVGTEGLASIVCGDLNRDGILDIAGLAGNQVRVFEGLGAREFRGVPSPRPLYPLFDCYPGRVAIAEIAPSGGPGIIVLRLVSMTDDTLFTPHAGWKWTASSFALPDGPRPTGGRNAIALADLDTDGDLDLFCCNSDLYMNDRGVMRCVTAEDLPIIGNRQTGAAFGDIDNDGDMDLFVSVDIWKDRYSGTLIRPHSVLFRNDGGRFVEATEQMLDGVSSHAFGPILEDFDLDGDLDLFYCQNPKIEPSPTGRWSRNVYLENDGAGRFTRAGAGSWVAESPPANGGLAGDFDGDGDPDLLLMARERRETVFVPNPTYPSSSAHSVSVRVLDRRGAPHAGGAGMRLTDASGKLIGYRQTGVGSIRPGVGVALFGIPGDARPPYDLEVAFGGVSGNVTRRQGIRAGDKLLIIQPAWSGPLGAQAAVFLHRWRGMVRGIASSGLPAILALALVAGGFCGDRFHQWFRSKKVRPLRGHHPASPEVMGFYSPTPLERVPPHIRSALGIVAAITIILTLLTSKSWPHHSVAVRNGLAGIGAFFLSSGFAVVALRIVDSRAARATQPLLRSRQRELLQAIDGFSHADWVKYLGKVSQLAASLREGADPQLIRPLLSTRIESYRAVIHPQIESIRGILPDAGLPLDTVRAFETAASAIDQGAAYLLSEAGTRTGATLDSNKLRLFADAAGRMREVINGIFDYLGRTYQADLFSLVRFAAERSREEHPELTVKVDFADAAAPVFGVPGDLANILENLFSNAARACADNPPGRPPYMAVTGRREGGLMVVAFEDNGAGMDPARLETLFAGRTVGSESHGRGLAYAFRVIQQFDGKLHIGSRGTGHGCRVTITLRVLRSKYEQRTDG